MKLADRIGAEKDLRVALLQASAGLLLIGGAMATWRQVVIAQAQYRLNVTIRVATAFTSALEQIGAAESIPRRVGGVYALERIAAEDPTEKPRVVGVLCAFIRQPPQHAMASISPDVQAALAVLSRIKSPHERIILDEAKLRGANLRGLNFEQASFRGAVLADADLTGASLRGCDLTAADLRNAALKGADLSEAVTEEALLSAGDVLGTSSSRRQPFPRDGL
ncbi:pentapeptide repeat-containing protein [Micromonospora chalcea]|uniref:pentapeptide repeat-containing protein n=1 Tax=Micromonospora chalcea TaxID=1874 RepID=UPI0037F7532F